MKLNTQRFAELQTTLGLNDLEFSEALKISRVQLWRIKTGANVGEKFISAFNKKFPDATLNDYFF